MGDPNMKKTVNRLILTIVGSFFVLFITACAIGDSMPSPYYSVDRVGIYNKIVYVHVTEKMSSGMVTDDRTFDHYYQSMDYGQTWKELQITDNAIQTLFNIPKEGVVTACLEKDPNTCYRIMGNAKVEISHDAGANWSTDWKIPVGRYEYMERNPALPIFYFVFPDIIPNDLGLLEMDNGYFVIVAMGNQGVLVRSPENTWERYPITYSSKEELLATPFPYKATNLNEVVQYTAIETAMDFVLSFILFMSLSFFAWRKIYLGSGSNDRKSISRSYIPFRLLTLPLLLQIVLTFPSYQIISFFDNYFQLYDPDLIMQVFCGLPFIGLGMTWWLVSDIFPNRGNFLLVAVISIAITAIFYGGIRLIFSLWALGIIPIHGVAQLVSLIFGVFIIYIGLLYEKKYLKLALLENEQEIWMD